jgi:hypothetical protein
LQFHDKTYFSKLRATCACRTKNFVV